MTKTRILYLGFLGALGVLTSVCRATEFYVSPTGNGDGSLTRPWSLATALAQPSTVKPGDTIWLRGGTYSGNFVGNLNGAANAPIIVRQYPGERAIIDGAASPTDITFYAAGSWTWYWGFEITNSYPVRYLPAGVVRGSTTNFLGTNSKFINMVIHDGGEGVSFWTPAQNSEVYGTLIYYNGFDLSDRGHGHGIYVQNATGTKNLTDNIIFDQFGWGIHAYTEGGNIDNITSDGNISFNNGAPSFSGYTDNILVGGLVVAQNPVITNNYTYFTPSVGAGYNNIGYIAGCANAIINNNYFASGGMSISLPNTVPASLTGNTFYGATPGWLYGSFPNNTYYGSRPTGIKVYVRPNRYEPGRANIAIFNWDLAASVSVSLSATGLAIGSTFEIRDSENFFGAPVVSGVYNGGTVSIPMKGLTKAPPVGSVAVVPPHTAPEFGAFVVLPTGGTPPPANVSVTVSPSTASLYASQQAQFTPTVIGTTNAAVTWSVTPAGTGSVSSTGLYTAPAAIGSTQTVSVTATSAADTTKAGSAAITLLPTPVGGTATAQFVTADTTTQGSWKTAYGGDGYNVLGDTASYPSYAAVTPGGISFWTWASTTTDIRGLQQASGSSRVAATWYAAPSFTVDVNLTDGKVHPVALYCVDWDNSGRTETVDVLDGVTGAVLDTRSVTGFYGGRYLLWNVGGHVIFRFTKTAGNNAVMSGIFFGGVSTAPPPPPPPSSANAAQFVKLDTATQGNWKSGYGAEGFNVLGDSTAYGSFATLTPAGQSAWTWVASTADVRGLQKNAGTDRVAATWYAAGSFTVDVNLTDGKAHQMAIYCLDWESAGRGQTIDILDAGTNAVLDSRSVSGFVNGQYVVWNVTGHVTVRITRTAGNNAAISGIFFGGAPVVVANSAQFVKLDTATQGSWKGVYGTSGYNVLGDVAAYPSYAMVGPAGQSAWTWAASTSDVRGLQKSAASDRVAATWYAAGSFTVDVNLTDGKTHQMAIYCLDWENAGRGQTIDILDAGTNVVLDSRSVSGFLNGQYVVWNVSGHVTVRITRTAGNNAVISGIFF